MSGGFRLKLDPPKEYSGKGEFEEFSKRLRSYLCLYDRRYSSLARWVCAQGLPIAREIIQHVFGNDPPYYQAMIDNLGATLYFTLS